MPIRIPESFDSKFRFIVVAAARAKQLLNGAPPKIEGKSRKPAGIAVREVEAGLIGYEIIDVHDLDEELVEEEPASEES